MEMTENMARVIEHEYYAILAALPVNGRVAFPSFCEYLTRRGLTPTQVWEFFRSDAIEEGLEPPEWL